MLKTPHHEDPVKRGSEPVMAVTAIKDGTVIDHIPAGNAVILLRLLKMNSSGLKATVGLHLPSTKMVCKDIIKVESFNLSPPEASKIAIFAPKATFSIIQNYHVVEKFNAALPESIENCIFCPNGNCITNHENCSRKFFVCSYKSEVQLLCKYCEKTFRLNALTRFAI